MLTACAIIMILQKGCVFGASISKQIKQINVIGDFMQLVCAIIMILWNVYKTNKYNWRFYDKSMWHSNDFTECVYLCSQYF